MPPETEVNLGALLDRAAALLRAAGVAEPRREARWLWEATLAQAAGLEALVARRAAGEPLAYVTGTAGFRHLSLGADARALIPRPETEGIVDLALARVRRGHAVDLGTGSGCLALALRQEGDFELVVGTDRCAGALALAGENARRTALPVRLVHADFGAGLAGGVFDLLIANPPYLTDAELDRLDPAVRCWEPALALCGGPDGLVATRRILGVEGRLLRGGGWLVMELDSSRSAAAAALAREAGWLDVAVHDDLFGRPRYLTARRGHDA